MRCTDVSCWYLLVFLGPQSINKKRSCFLCIDACLKTSAKVLQFPDIRKRSVKKDQKGLCEYGQKTVILHRKQEEASKRNINLLNLFVYGMY